jgi:hypothetical protein
MPAATRNAIGNSFVEQVPGPVALAKRRESTCSIDWHRLLPEEFSAFRIVTYHELDPF